MDVQFYATDLGSTWKTLLELQRHADGTVGKLCYLLKFIKNKIFQDKYTF